MLNEKWIPTPIPSHDQGNAQDVEIGTATTPRWRRLQVIMRLLELVKNLFLLWVRRQWSPKNCGICTRNFFESLGFLWIKAGQLVALRHDFFSSEFCIELGKLQYIAKGFSPELSCRIIEEELGTSLDCVFDHFESHPFAAASIGQVHKARIRGEKRDVVVKVMRPDTAEMFALDVEAMRNLVKVLSRFSTLSFLRLDEAVWEIDQVRIEETDFRYELANMKQMRANLKKHPKVYVPKPFFQYCGKNVLVIEFVQGVLMSEYITLFNEDAEAVTDWERENNVDPVVVGESFYKSAMRQLFEDNLFHADPHPGNIMLLKDNRFVLIDFGTVGSSEMSMWRKHLSFSKAVATDDYELAADIFLSYCRDLPASLDAGKTRRDLIRAMRSWGMRAEVADLPYYEKSVANSLQIDLLQVALKHGFVLDWEFLKLDRSWMTMDTSVGTLNPRVNYPQLYRKYFRERGSRELPKSFRPRSLLSSIDNRAEDLLTYRNMFETQIRSAVRTFESAGGGINHAVGILFGSLAKVIALIGGDLVAVLLHQHYDIFELIGYDRGGIFHNMMKLAALAPLLAYPVWSLAIVIAFLVWYKLRKVTARLQRSDVRLPPEV